ncbi:hypothetical protein H4R20_002354 [Coemansia guatemalensis]|uniref:Amino acid transporter transmembrane domain-containing protein n=1 Tax=Coemansia guatemalensis TaxID=2761395 RepID=A0A9W8LV37_9FUNG|nr:hypothetical protein H4R20_002354 [Coemansia guatemalensis]
MLADSFVLLAGPGVFGFNVLNTIIGSGIVALPYAIYNAGFVFGMVMLGAVALLSQFSLYALVVSGKRTGTAHFSSLTEAALGKAGYHLLNSSMLIDMVGTVILYLMLIGDMGVALADIYLPVSVSRTSVIVVVSLVAILPLLFFRNTGPLSRFSIISTLCLPYIIVAVALRAPHFAGEVEIDFSVFGPRVLPAMGILSFTFSSCHGAFPNYLGLRNRSTAAWVHASSFATAGAAAISLAFAVSGYLSFGNTSHANILDNFPESDNVINIGRLLFAVSLVFTAPMGFYPIRDTVTEMLKIDPERYNVSRMWESTCTVTLFTICVFSATMLTDLGLAYELIGALSTSAVNFLLPGLVYLWAGTDVTFARIITREKTLQPVVDSDENTPLLSDEDVTLEKVELNARNIGLWALAWVVVVFGVWVMVLGTYTIGSD